jgi:hypothetical protein
MEITVTNIIEITEVNAQSQVYEVVIEAYGDDSKKFALQAKESADISEANAQQTALDRIATGEDAAQTALDRIATGQDAITATTQAGIATTKAQEAEASADSIKITQVTGVTVTAASFSLVSGLWEAVITNSNIPANGYVDVVPDRSTILIVKDAEFLPDTVSTSGQVKVFATNQPTGNFLVTLNIQPTN